MDIIAHRGRIDGKEENRIDVILKTLSYSYIDGVEIDVRMTKDGTLVLGHNLLVYTSTGEIKNIAKERYRNIKKLHFIRKNTPYMLDTLHAFFKKVHTDKIILLDCKEEYGRNKLFVKSLLKELKGKNLKNVIVCSFSYDLLKFFQKYSFISTGLLVGYLLNLKKDYRSFDYLLLSPSSVSSHSESKPYYVWTVNKKQELDKFIQNNNFVGIITDKGNIFRK